MNQPDSTAKGMWNSMSAYQNGSKAKAVLLDQTQHTACPYISWLTLAGVVVVRQNKTPWTLTLVGALHCDTAMAAASIIIVTSFNF